MRKSTLVTIALAFLFGIGAVVWVCYISFKGSVMAFDSTNSPGPLATPPPTRPPPPVGAPVLGGPPQGVPVLGGPPQGVPTVGANAPAPVRHQQVFPTSIPTFAPGSLVTPAPNLKPNGPPPPDG